YLATYDMLTGLMNRASFKERLERELQQSVRTGISGALLYFELDNFKDINDSFGHHTGDELLQRVAGSVQRQLRNSDLLARLGGDEFAVLLPRTRREDAHAIG